MSPLETYRFVQVPLSIEAFQFTGGADNAKAIINRLLKKGEEATWRPAWVSYERGLFIDNVETLEIRGRTFITLGDWVILKPNILKVDGVELIVLDDTRFKDRYMSEKLTPARETHTEDTLQRVYNVLGRLTDDVQSRAIVSALQDNGIVFKERI